MNRNRFLPSPKRVVVAGPPGAGKTTYVNSRKNPGDIVWDYDAIMSAITGLPIHEKTMAAHTVVHAMREAFMRTIRTVDADIWIISSAATVKERAEFERLGMKIATLATEESVCLDQIKGRDNYDDFALSVARWWDRYEP